MARYSNAELILREFFADENVRFPQCPSLVEGLHVYKAPWGLGVQFRGGAERIVVRGGGSYATWDYLSKNLDGSKTLSSLLAGARDKGLDALEVASFLKTLHCYHLLKESSTEREQPIEVEVGPNLGQQMDYYNRILPLTGRNTSSNQALRRLTQTKVLLIANEEILSFAIRGLYEACIRNIGIIKVTKKGEPIEGFKVFEGVNVLAERTFKYNEAMQVGAAMHAMVEDYSYVLSVLKEPSVRFLGDIAHICNIKQRPFLPVSLAENENVIGPFFFPHMDTACVTCANLRRQSVVQGAVDDYVYQQSLYEKGEVSDTNILGFDIQCLHIALNIAVFQLKQQIAELSSPRYINTELRLNTLDLSIRREVVVRVPGCISCSD